MDEGIYLLEKKYWPKRLLEIPEPPKKLFIKGKLPNPKDKWLCIVGSRKYSPYGKEVCEKLIEGLKGYPVVIVSGLAVGIDEIAHKKALEVGLRCVGIPGSGLLEKFLYPSSNIKLAREISKNGCLLSEFEPDQVSALWTFPRRNRIMAGLCDAVLIIEAKAKSGTLITSRLATDYNRDVFTVPGSIFNKNADGPNLLLKLGATPITSSCDILEALNLDIKDEQQKIRFENNLDLNKEEREVLELIENYNSLNEVINKSKLDASKINEIISRLELEGFVEIRGDEIRVI